jgi:hypothetical protein
LLLGASLFRCADHGDPYPIGTIPPITNSFEDAVRALLKTPPPPKNLGRPKAKKKKEAKKR